MNQITNIGTIECILLLIRDTIFKRDRNYSSVSVAIALPSYIICSTLWVLYYSFNIIYTKRILQSLAGRCKIFGMGIKVGVWGLAHAQWLAVTH
jgi:hypothetical protein